MLRLNFLGILFANGVKTRIEIPLIGTPENNKSETLPFLCLYNQTFKKHLIILPRKIGFYNSNSAKFLS
jgi:hypothetical protein